MSDPSTVPHNAALMASPCNAGLSPHSAWIVFSAPEITTVSKPNRNPPSAAMIAHITTFLLMVSP